MTGAPDSMEAVQSRHPEQPARYPPPNPPVVAGVAELPTNDFVTCYETHYRKLVRALGLAGADRATAEDVAQEAFARALVHWARVSKGSNPPGYVYTAGFRLLRRAQRKRRPTAPEPYGSLGAGDPIAAYVASSLSVEAALAAMPPRRRACAVMCLVVGLSVHEAGEALGIADGTVRKHLDEARRELSAALSPGV